MNKLWLVFFVVVMSFTTNASDLTEKELKGYLTALPNLAKWSEAHPALKNTDFLDMIGKNDGSLTTQLVSMLKENNLYAEFSTLAEQYGFSAERLIEVSTQVSMGYIASMKAQMPPEVQAKMNEVMGQLAAHSKGDASKSDASALLNSMGKINKISEQVSANDLALIKQHMPAIQKAFESIQH